MDSSPAETPLPILMSAQAQNVDSTTTPPGVVIPTEPAHKQIKNQPQSNKTKLKGKKPSIKFNISNLHQIATKPPAPSTSMKVNAPSEPKPVGTYFTNLRLKPRLDVDKGSTFTIDVQPDMRFMTYYVSYTTTEAHEEIVISNNPYCSVPSLIGYKLHQFIFQHLIFDIHARKTKSPYCTIFEDEARLTAYLTNTLQTKVSIDLCIPLEQLAPAFDPLRSRLEFVPNMANFHFKLDFGRSIPAYVYFIVHNILADCTEFTSTQDVMNLIYSTVFITFGGIDYTISNLFGGPYDDGQNTSSHANWFRNSFETTMMPIIGYVLSERPTLVHLPIKIPNFENEDVINPYVYLTVGCIDNVPNVLEFIMNISDVINMNTSDLKPLGQLFTKVSGLTILSHSLESASLPTWHTLKYSNKEETRKRKINDQVFAQKVQFLTVGPSYTGTLKYPTTAHTIKPELYLVQNKKFSPNKTPVPYTLFKPQYHLLPDVFWLQPYVRSTSLLNHTVILGIKIESEEFDGVTIPLPNPQSTLIDENSMYAQGAVPYEHLILPAACIIINDVDGSLLLNANRYIK